MANLSITKETCEPRRDKPGHWISLFAAILLLASVLAGAWVLAEYIGTEWKLQFVGCAAFIVFLYLCHKVQGRRVDRGGQL